MDVTLREGIYLGQGTLNYSKALNYLNYMVKHGFNEDIDFIEIGYLNTDKKGNMNYDEEYITDALNICKKYFKISMMMHPEQTDISLWNPKLIAQINMIRIVIHEDHIPETVRDIIKYIHELGTKVSINIAYVMNKTSKVLLNMYRTCLEFDADYIYCADSSGSMIPADTVALCKMMVDMKGKNYLGLHFHDHFQMALANALEAKKAGIDIVDVSITGAGKGGGNLKTEFAILLFRLLDGKEISQVLIKNMLEYIQYFNKIIEYCDNSSEKAFLDFLTGLLKIKLKLQKKVEELAEGNAHKYIEELLKVSNLSLEKK